MQVCIESLKANIHLPKYYTTDDEPAQYEERRDEQALRPEIGECSTPEIRNRIDQYEYPHLYNVCHENEHPALFSGECSTHKIRNPNDQRENPQPRCVCIEHPASFSGECSTHENTSPNDQKENLQLNALFAGGCSTHEYTNPDDQKVTTQPNSVHNEHPASFSGEFSTHQNTNPYQTAAGKIETEILNLRKAILEEELLNKRKQWEFEEAERKHLREMWALEKQESLNKSKFDLNININK